MKAFVLIFLCLLGPSAFCFDKGEVLMATDCKKYKEIKTYNWKTLGIAFPFSNERLGLIGSYHNFRYLVKFCVEGKVKIKEKIVDLKWYQDNDRVGITDDLKNDCELEREVLLLRALPLDQTECHI